MANRIQLRRGTAAQWTAANPVLAQGEPGIETDTGKQKFGNGTAAWSALAYASAGPQGAAGAAGVADDTSVKNLINTPGSATATALNATYGPAAQAASAPVKAAILDQSQVARSQLVSGGNKPLNKRGIVVYETRAGNSFWDNALVESPCVFRDPVTSKLAMIYTGYTNTDGTAIASHGIAYSDDGIRWTGNSQYFAGSGVVGSPDEKGVTGPVTLFEDGIQHLFYIGLTAVGYEGGTKTVCHATRPIGTGAWTRLGAVLTEGGSGWRATHVWHPNFVKRGSTWYCFINATGLDGKERVGVAQATNLDGPWTFRDDLGALLTDPVGAEAAWQVYSGDPFVRQLKYGGWRMDFFKAGSTSGYDAYATTTAEKFPGGWIERGATVKPTPNSYDDLYAHKPWIIELNGEEFHYYTCVTGSYRRIALATSGQREPVLIDTTGTAGATNSIARALIRSGAGLDATAPTILDTFTRANGAVGGATTGQAWTADSGWAIASNKLVWSGAADGLCTIDTGLTEFDAEIVFDVVSGGQYPFGFSVGDPAGMNITAYKDGLNWVMNTRNVNTILNVQLCKSPFTAGVVMLRRRDGRLTIETNGVVTNAFTTSTITGTKITLRGSGNQGATISRVTVVPKSA